ncbi:MarR family winged helix-turn-helix transcriptional regulator [Texcoconibacillus texcoconensis]|uniref:DNA-binding MarR family transcriptional regulator n=1 Tax=Texcoconibacillus texcoconensis TaxID=1095777 RepID=A0A840QSD4_9BACI|nr:MarR family transcriptional regulator [Texcoconibacillus texcoconensis]MBB5174274.1 DNA-binding MarR family transcriptional regulator [Texcoconibacillus texcoconensis]
MARELDQMLGYHIGVVSHLIQKRHNQNLAKYDLTTSQAKVLYFLTKHGEQTQVELQRRLYIQASSMNGIIDSMRKNDLIEKRNHPNDGRTKVIQLTDKGSDLEKQLWSEVEIQDEELLEGFTNEEQQLMISWLKRIETNMKDKLDC